MSRLLALVHGLTQHIQPFAARLGVPGLALVAFIDSSSIPLPEVPDMMVILAVMRHPAAWLWTTLVATGGSVAGCYVVYAIALKGGEAFVRARVHEKHLEHGLALFRRYGLVAIVIPALLPPPMPFKPFILAAGLAGVRPATFAGAIALGRGLRFVVIAWFARTYGDAAFTFIQTKLPAVSLWAAIAIGVAGVVVLLLRRRRAT